MTIRILPPEEWDRLRTIFATEGVALPNPNASIVVAEDRGEIVGFLVAQFVPHLEPLWIDPAYRGKVWWPSLVNAAVEQIHGGEYFVFAPDARIERMAEFVGLEPLPWTVYRGVMH